ncbi:hypothetical protein AM500_12265 [Bacillus sp. FJAT-18017]|uniref:hypothetical protein n=1 Tax=Bacillus sp. FJAT-18017 TaxID=1705566 RepID=UPI0006AEBA50|nr:hypothetical protein [Bacillus sp. FJAT-18017]ALC90475.1 hypothetical protein AM500_12265 [Bacillus sp. FJAT-18017]
MKIYKLTKHFKGIEKGTHFYLIAESEFIGVKEFVLRSEDLSLRLSLNEQEFQKNFRLIYK